jgi:predicted enzyme related to lactoylglutathione lyase
MNEHEKINYVEFPAKDIEATKAFFISAFGWTFVDYGPEYTAFANEGIVIAKAISWSFSSTTNFIN